MAAAAAAAAAAGGDGGGKTAPGATDIEITRALHSILREKSVPSPNPNYPNPTVTTFNDVVLQLQSKLGVDLSHKLDFIRSQIQLLFQLPATQHPHPHPHPTHLQQQPPPHPVVVPSKEHFVFQHHPQYHHPTNFHPSPSAFHTFPPHPMGHHPHVQFQAQAHPRVHAVASRVEPSPKESAPAKPKRKGGTGGLSKLCRVSPELQAIVGQPAMPRTEIVRQLWAYIRKNNLQDPNNKRKIICNDELRLVFETDCTDMFKMNKLLAKHIGPLEPTKESEPKKLKVEVDPGVKSSSESGPSVKISEDLANFFGVSDTVMPQKEITERIWQYIYDNQLLDRQNSTLVQCDDKLQKIFGRESIPALEIPEVLAHHLIRR